MQMQSWYVEPVEMTQPLTPSWLSAVGFDIAYSCTHNGWIVLIDPEELPTQHQCQFYGLNPEHFLVVRSSSSRSVDSIIAEFNRAKTAVAILTWRSPKKQRLSHIPLYDLKLGVKHDTLTQFAAMPAATLRLH